MEPLACRFCVLAVWAVGFADLVSGGAINPCNLGWHCLEVEEHQVVPDQWLVSRIT